MLKKFSTFITEVYSGPQKSPGFVYSGKPTYKYGIQFIIVTSLEINILENEIPKILEDLGVESSEFSIENLNQNLYLVKFSVNCFTETEAASIFKSLNRELQGKYSFKFKIEDISIT